MVVEEEGAVLVDSAAAPASVMWAECEAEVLAMAAIVAGELMEAFVEDTAQKAA